MGDARAQLLDVVRQVRRRWRIKLALRGAVGFLLAGLVAILAIAYALETLQVHAQRRSSGSASSPALVLVAAGAWFFARPLSRKVTDEQVALYLEEHEPTLDATILSAMEVSERPGDWSPALIERLVENAIERVHEIQDGERIEREPMRRYAGSPARRGRRGSRALHVRARRTCATRCRRCSSSRATSKPRRRIASRSSPATPPCRRARIRRSTPRSRASMPPKRRS